MRTGISGGADVAGYQLRRMRGCAEIGANSSFDVWLNELEIGTLANDLCRNFGVQEKIIFSLLDEKISKRLICVLKLLFI